MRVECFHMHVDKEGLEGSRWEAKHLLSANDAWNNTCRSRWGRRAFDVRLSSSGVLLAVSPEVSTAEVRCSFLAPAYCAHFFPINGKWVVLGRSSTRRRGVSSRSRVAGTSLTGQATLCGTNIGAATAGATGGIAGGALRLLCPRGHEDAPLLTWPLFCGSP